MSKPAGQIFSVDDCDESSLGYMLRLAAPMVITTISFTVMQFVDRFMVSRLGTAALAAILPAGIVSFVPAAFMIGITTAITTFVSQSVGRGTGRGSAGYVWQTIYMGLLYFGVVVVTVWPLAPYIFGLMGHSDEVVLLEVTYLRIVLFAQVIAVFIWCTSQFFMGIHRPVITMYAALCGQAVNVFANYCLIFGEFGFPRLGIAGAALGTLAGLLVGAAIRMSVFLGRPMNSRYETRKGLWPDFTKMKGLLRIGAPAGVELVVNVSFWGFILFWLVGQFGNEALAATSAVVACTNFVVMPIVGLKIALTAAVGASIGGQATRSAVKQTHHCLRIALIYMAVVGSCFLVFRKGIMQLWSSDDEVIRTGMNILIFAAIYQVFHAVRIVYSGTLRGAGDTLWLALVSSTGAIVILGFGGFIFVRFFPQVGVLGPWAAAAASVIAVGLANRRRFKSGKWLDIDLFREQRVVPLEVEQVSE